MVTDHVFELKQLHAIGAGLSGALHRLIGARDTGRGLAVPMGAQKRLQSGEDGTDNLGRALISLLAKGGKSRQMYSLGGNREGVTSIAQELESRMAAFLSRGFLP